jgi:hypothetical protein
MVAQNHYFKAYAGDEGRMFLGVSCEAEGMWSKLRRIAHDRQPYGFLVDAYYRPYPEKHLADMCHLSNSRFEALLYELRKHGALQTPAEFAGGLRALGEGRPKVLKLLAAFNEMCELIAGEDAATTLLVPPLVRQHIDTTIAKRDGSQGGNPHLRSVPQVPDLNEGVNPMDIQTPPPVTITTGLTTSVKPQRSKVKGQRSNIKGHRLKKENAATSAGARPELVMQDEEAPWSWKQHKFYCDEVRRWEGSLSRDVLDDGDRYESHFRAKFHFEYELFQRAVEHYAHGPRSLPIPQSCADGFHVREETGNRCRYCRDFVAEGA